jgi:hypothetical protein
MSGSSAPEIDPRFDPRFQRGYVPDASASSPPRLNAVPSRQQSGAVSDSTDADSEAALGASLAAGNDQGAGPTAVRDGVSGPHPDSEVAADVGEVAPEAAVADVRESAQPDELAPVEPAPPATRWFWIAIGVCLAFIAIGSLLYWNLASDPRRYSGPMEVGVDATIRMVVSALSPALVIAGVIGIVGVLATWAISGRRVAGTRR